MTSDKCNLIQRSKNKSEAFKFKLGWGFLGGMGGVGRSD